MVFDLKVGEWHVCIFFKRNLHFHVLEKKLYNQKKIFFKNPLVLTFLPLFECV